jgi:FkbM family methyltransferase
MSVCFVWQVTPNSQKMRVKDWLKWALDASGLEINRVATSDHILEGRLRALIEKLQIDTVIDVGANEGQFAQLLSKVDFRGDVASFEPVPELYQRLQTLFAGERRRQAYPYACGSKNETTIIHVAESSDFSSILEPNSFCLQEYPTARFIRSETVEMRRLDSLLPTLYPNFFERRILLKIDTQGYDHQVFSGTEAILDSIKLLQVEMPVIPLYEEALPLHAALNLYSSAGFAVSGMFPVSYTKDRLSVIEYDCLLVSQRPSPNYSNSIKSECP